MSSRPIRIVVADTHEIVRRGLVLLLGAQEGFEVVGEAANGAVALEKVLSLDPDVVVLDVVMPVTDGTEALRARATGRTSWSSAPSCSRAVRA